MVTVLLEGEGYRTRLTGLLDPLAFLKSSTSDCIDTSLYRIKAYKNNILLYIHLCVQAL